jgi:hypothetical protein
MTKNSHHRRPHVIAVGVLALAAVTVAGCSATAGSTAFRAASDSPATTAASIPAPAPGPVSAPSAPVTVTVTAPPPVTVTVTVAAPPPVAPVVYTGSGAFRSPSGNISCAMFASDVRCDVAEHNWTPPPPSPACHLDWGSRFKLEQGGASVFDCYAQELPAPEQILGYGQSRSFGSITCDSESTGMTCTDGSTGHYFRISRENYEIG